jgi:hypothetical protein
MCRGQKTNENARAVGELDENLNQLIDSVLDPLSGKTESDISDDLKKRIDGILRYVTVCMLVLICITFRRHSPSETGTSSICDGGH